jgi:hypothetical protein
MSDGKKGYTPINIRELRHEDQDKINVIRAQAELLAKNLHHAAQCGVMINVQMGNGELTTFDVSINRKVDLDPESTH